MIKLIFKNIWANRGRYLPVIIELILIAAVAWLVLEPVIVNKYFLERHPGYDRDRLVRIELGERYTGDEYTHEDRLADAMRVLARLRALPEVEAATVTTMKSFESNSISANSFPSDTIDGGYFEIDFVEGTDFFKTFGIRVSGGPDDGKVFEEPPLGKRDRVITRGVAQVLYPGVNPVGHYLNENSEFFTHGKEEKIVGVVDDVLYRSNFARSAIVFMPLSQSNFGKNLRNSNYATLVARMKPGVDPADFVREHYESISHDLSSGRTYAHSPMTFVEYYQIKSIDLSKQVFLYSALALFLIVNLFLCVTGTFYLQTRGRSRDAGIMRAFGASRRSVCFSMIAEGWMMTIAAWVIGCVGVYFWVKKEGMTTGADLMGQPSQVLMDAMPLWTDNFALHFGVVSLVVLVLLLVAVTVGIYLPARNISRINPVDALREE